MSSEWRYVKRNMIARTACSDCGAPPGVRCTEGEGLVALFARVMNYSHPARAKAYRRDLWGVDF